MLGFSAVSSAAVSAFSTAAGTGKTVTHPVYWAGSVQLYAIADPLPDQTFEALRRLRVVYPVVPQQAFTAKPVKWPVPYEYSDELVVRREVPIRALAALRVQVLQMWIIV